MRTSKKALLVSGTLVVQTGISQLLEWLGFETVKASSGAQAVDIYTADPSYDLVVLDTDMPGLNGFKTAGLVRERQIAKRPYIVGTSSNQEHSEKVLQAGMDAYFVTPNFGRPPKQIFAPFSLIHGGLQDA